MSDTSSTSRSTHISFDPAAVLARVKESLAETKAVEMIVFGEQSDKEHLMVLVEFKVAAQEDATLLRSDTLLKLAKLRGELKAEAAQHYHNPSPNRLPNRHAATLDGGLEPLRVAV